VALAYVLAAREAGISDLEIQMMSLTIYSAAAQIATVQLMAGGASALTVFVTVLVMNLHHVAYGLSLAKHIAFTRAEKAIAAYALTDAAYGFTIAAQNNWTLLFLLGAELSMFLAWNLSTAAALLTGQILAALKDLPLDLIVPVTFFVLLTRLIKTRTDLMVAVFSSALAVALVCFGMREITVIATSIGGPLVGFSIAHARNTKGEFLTRSRLS
jgi:predicted branched-subunit amino acid permease